MDPIAFVDTEIDPKSHKVLDIGSIKEDGSSFHKTSMTEFIQFLGGTRFICGHNIFNHDVKYLGEALKNLGLDSSDIIDTLYLSPLLYPTKPYHHLVKDDKLQSEDLNNPLNDSIKARDLFHDEVAAFRQLDNGFQELLYQLLGSQKEFHAFFRFLGYTPKNLDLKSLIHGKFGGEICQNVDLDKLIAEHPIDLAYALSLINSLIHDNKKRSITPRWVLKNYLDVERIMFLLRNRPCIAGCTYCNHALDVHRGLKQFFGFDGYRTFGGEPLQERAVKAAVDNKSILAVFPTGGGKSITFQVPALMSGESSNGLTVVISPLQSLMKDQVDNLEQQGITEAVTINGMLDPIERAKAYERVEDGSASLLYIAPESLRSRSIERLILGRKIVRFVIDEAHCFSSWGQDFRVDYLYIGDFIKMIQEKKNLVEGIPVSCFTATAKQKVIEDIQDYLREKLGLDLELFTSKASRSNLQYQVYGKADEEEKYQTLRDLIEAKNCPTIVYVSRTRKAYLLAERLSEDGFNARPYHSKMDIQEKSTNQNAFISGEVPIMVATSAFGMGVDKKDVGLVVHYEISDSLENYIQEAGRAGRDENLVADCFILFNEEDLGKHFVLLNQTKISIKEIQQVWKAIKEITKFRSTVSNSALEIARKAGWDDNVLQLETRVTTAIAALENAGYLRRGQNMPRVFANSILSKNAQEAIDKINASDRFAEGQKEKGIRIIKKLISSKSRKPDAMDSPESRVDYISDHLGIVREEVINIVNLLREENILADAMDLTAYIRKRENRNRSLKTVVQANTLESFLFPLIDEQEKALHLKELNEMAESNGCTGVSTASIKTIVNFWAIKNWVKRHKPRSSKDLLAMNFLHPKEVLQKKMEKRHAMSVFFIEYLYGKTDVIPPITAAGEEEILVEFSVHELKDVFENSISNYGLEPSIADVEDALFYLSRIGALKVEGGFLVIYNRLTIERIQLDNHKQYTKEDYRQLNQFYESKIQQIHIVGEYAKKMMVDYRGALQFVDDYFQLNYGSFLRKYFPGNKVADLKLKMTPGKFRKLFGELSPTQLKIINDSESQHIVVAAGPGSGKTKVLVHKLASLLLMEDVRHEQLLMVTFSRAAATEFKKRLRKLIGGSTHYVDIKTFHSYCFDLLGKVGNLEKSDGILKIALEKISQGEVEPSRITKTVLVIDEAQDMDRDEFNLVRALMERNDAMRVIAVGDDDQNIYEFRGASSKYLEAFIRENGATKYELVENFRSKSNLVAFTDRFVHSIQHRLKTTPAMAKQTDDGKIRVVRYQSTNLITPLVDAIIRSDIRGTTGVLTKTNDEALQITGLLLKNGVRAKLIQTNDGFSIYDLVEIRFFLDQLDVGEGAHVAGEEKWETAKGSLESKYRDSTVLEICKNIIGDFEAIHPNGKYLSDLKVFLQESRLEDFFNGSRDTIFVSTIHKAKGREFDNVYLLLDNFEVRSDENRRQLYVAMTRAKQNLHLHLNGRYLDHIKVTNMEFLDDKEIYLPPNEMAMHLTHRDVWLDYFISRQNAVSLLKSGEELVFDGEGCLNSKGQSILKFSQHFLGQIQQMEAQGYKVKTIRVNFIFIWYKKEKQQEFKVVIPEVFFEKFTDID